MAIPTQSQYPTDFDDATTLLGQITNHQVFTLDGGFDVSSLSAVFNESLASLELPTYLVFDGGEIWFVDVGQVGGTGNTTITLDNFNQRGVSGSSIQPHVDGEKVFTFFSEQYHYLLKDAIINTQKFLAQTGDDADKPDSPLAGQVYYASDIFMIYVCFSNGVWTELSMGNHNSLLNLTAADAHGTIYHNDARALTWHNALSGGHVLSGDDHDHSSTGEGGAVKRVRAGTFASRSSPSFVGELYFAYDDGEGALYISYDATNWASVAGVPPGGIAMFSSSCPTGWTRYTDLDGAFAKIGSSYVGLIGSDTHTHTYSGIIEHYHGIPALSGFNTDTVTHSHQPAGGSALYGNDAWGLGSSGTSGGTSSSSGGHSHVSYIASSITATGGASGAETDSGNSIPLYAEVVFCQKD